MGVELFSQERVSPTRSLKAVPAAGLIGPALQAAAKIRISQWNARSLQPKQVQLDTLLKHCRAASNTEFGRIHKFNQIRTYDDFKKQVPLRSYAEFEPYLDRMRNGARDILWPGLIPFYGQSSGSSNTAAKHKFLPISIEQIRWQKKAAFDLLAQYLVLTGDRTFSGGFNLGLFPPSLLKFESPGVYTGSNPGVMLRFIPAAAKMTAIPRPPIRDIPEYEEKISAIAENYFSFDVRSISGTTCWFTIMFERLLATAKKRGLPFSTISEIWPNLRVLFGGGVHAEPYRKVITQQIGRPIVLIDNYNATEGGIFAATDRLGEPGMLMLPDRGVFFEFVPRSEHGKPDATRVPLWEVEPFVDYSVVLSTSSGLFGYYIGDFVRFLSTFPHRLEFTGRASGVLSLTQELTSYLEIERSVSFANEQNSCTTVDYTASSEVGFDESGKGRYVFFVEFHQPPSDLESYIKAIDHELCNQNRVYREHRSKNVAILPPRLVCLAPGITKKFMAAIKYNSVQNKFPRIINAGQMQILNSFVENKENCEFEVKPPSTR